MKDGVLQKTIQIWVFPNFSYDQKQTYKRTKEEFDKHVAAKKKSNPGKAVLTLLYVKKVDLKNPIIRDGTKVC